MNEQGAAPMTHPHRPTNGRRPCAARAACASTLAVGLLVLALAGLPSSAAAQYAQPAGVAQPAPGQAMPQAQPSPQAAETPTEASAPQEEGAPPGIAFSSRDPLRIEGEYDIEELRRLVDLARESGFSEEQLRQITVEDESGNVVSALAFLEAYEKRQRESAEQTAAQEARVYLSPKDILEELDEKQPEDLDQLRERMLFVE